MRRFSQRNSLVTLSDINITPLLDLAFVLLIIFVITTPLLEQGMELRLPEGGRATGKVDRENVRTVEIDRNGRYMLERRLVSLEQLEQQLVNAFKGNPRILVRIRADKDSTAEQFCAVMDRCQRNGITQFQLRTEPARRR